MYLLKVYYRCWPVVSIAFHYSRAWWIKYLQSILWLKVFKWKQFQWVCVKYLLIYSSRVVDKFQLPLTVHFLCYFVPILTQSMLYFLLSPSILISCWFISITYGEIRNLFFLVANMHFWNTNKFGITQGLWFSLVNTDVVYCTCVSLRTLFPDDFWREDECGNSHICVKYKFQVFLGWMMNP